MKTLIALIILFVLGGCSQSSERRLVDQLTDTELECTKSVQFGDLNVCLPEIDGMKECSSNPAMKMYINETQLEGSTTLAYYVNNATCEYIDEIDEIEYDEFFSIYALNQLSGVSISNSDLDEAFRYTEASFVNESWGDSKRLIEEKVHDISVDRPIIIDSYALNNQVRTAVLLGKFQGEDFEDVMVYTLNLIKIQDRLIYLTYYKEYDGEVSVQKAKAKNDYVVLQLLNFNK